MPTNYKNTLIKVQTTLDSVPNSSSGTGTIITTGITVTGTGTLFLTEMPVGSWIVSAAAGEVRKVVNVTSNTTAEVDYAFTVDIVASTPKIITRLNSDVKEIGVLNSGGNTTTIDGANFPAGAFVTWTKTHRHDSTKQDFVDPVVVDGATSNCVITLTKN